MAAGSFRRLGVDIPPEMLNQLRFGRGVDNRRLKAAGFEYGYTSREAVIALGEHLRLHPARARGGEPYRYEREVEEFLRWSPNVRRPRVGNGRPFLGEGLEQMEAGAPVDRYDTLSGDEIVSLLGSLETPDLRVLRDYERDHGARRAVIEAIDAMIARSEASERPLGA